jgi:hypothetical protein
MGATMTEDTGPNLGDRFRKGQSGNPAGKPKGARHSPARRKLMQDDAENIVNAVLTAARKGDMTAAKIIFDRLVPLRRAVSFDLPKIERPADAGNSGRGFRGRFDIRRGGRNFEIDRRGCENSQDLRASSEIP